MTGGSSLSDDIEEKSEKEIVEKRVKPTVIRRRAKVVIEPPVAVPLVTNVPASFALELNTSIASATVALKPV